MYQSTASALLSLVCLTLTAAAPAPIPPLASWFQPEDTPVAALFKRYVPSPSDSNFTSNYPATGVSPTGSSLPSAWTSKLASLTLPNVAVSKQNNGYPTYDGVSGADKSVCSFTYGCTASDDLYNPPEGVIALSFDDGPTFASAELNHFLSENNISAKATHFMIGGNILYDPADMQVAANAGGHIAVHTWTHPYMTTLTNEQVLGELGWTMQIISDLNGGRLPKFWRPPYGDVDNRVRAIAKGVFNLETVVWNQDSADWAIGSSSTYTNASVEASITGWLTGNKTTGLCMLEHELNYNTVGVFMNEYPIMVSNGWKIETVPDAFGMPWYQNSGDADNKGPVTSMAVGAQTLAVNTTTAQSSTTSAVLSTSTTSSLSTSPTATPTDTTTKGAAASAVAAASKPKTGAAMPQFSIVNPLWVLILGISAVLL